MKSTTRRKYGQHFTSRQVFADFIFPHIRKRLQEFIWVDMYAGSGNLILPILDHISKENRTDFFKDHMYMFDVQESCVKECVQNAVSKGISQEIAEKNIQIRNSLEEPPQFLQQKGKPIFHVTNPPYLYLGYIAKHEETKSYLRYFKGKNEGYQDLYQIAMINDLRAGIEDLVYIIPSNFLYGSSVSNKFRKDFLKHYKVKRAVIFEKKMFKKTGTNVVVAFFEKKSRPSRETQVFEALKFSSTKENEDVLSKTRNYRLVPDYNYRAGADFEVFIEKRKVSNPLKYKYYLKQKEIDAHPGNEEISLIDANNYEGTQYARIKRKVSKEFAKKIRKNKLWVRTVDTGLWEGRAGLYLVEQNFDVDGILVTKNPYRTNPIQLFFKTEISPRMQVVLKDYVNSVLEHLRAITDSEFMTTYKYSNHDYIRKYFGLRQLRKIISTFPYHSLENGRLEEFKEIVKKRGVKEILTYLDSLD